MLKRPFLKWAVRGALVSMAYTIWLWVLAPAIPLFRSNWVGLPIVASRYIFDPFINWIPALYISETKAQMFAWEVVGWVLNALTWGTIGAIGSRVRRAIVGWRQAGRDHA